MIKTIYTKVINHKEWNGIYIYRSILQWMTRGGSLSFHNSQLTIPPTIRNSHSLCLACVVVCTQKRKEKKIASMETAPSLSIESFSRGWLMNLKPSFEGLDKSSCSTSFDASDEASFIEMDPKMPPSRRWFSGVPKDFSFDFRTSQSPLTFADADDLISADGVLMPLFGKLPLTTKDSYNGEAEEPASPMFTPLLDKKEVHSSNRVRCSSLRRCKRLSKRIFQKYLDFLRPLCQKLRGHRSGTSKVASVSSASVCENEGKNVESYSPATSPRTSVAWSTENWRRSCDSESCIYEAVLHCKRTHGK